MPRRPNRYRYLVRTDEVLDLVARRKLCHRDVAVDLGVTPGHWSSLVHRRCGLSQAMRDKLLASAAFRGVGADALWERVDGGAL